MNSNEIGRLIGWLLVAMIAVTMVAVVCLVFAGYDSAAVAVAAGRVWLPPEH